MEIIFGWLLLSIIAGAIGSSRNIGFWGTFLLSLILSPLVGIIVALASRRKDDIHYQKELLSTIANRPQQVVSTKEYDTDDITSQLERITKLKSEGHITEEEFQSIKSRILAAGNPPNVEEVSELQEEQPIEHEKTRSEKEDRISYIIWGIALLILLFLIAKNK